MTFSFPMLGSISVIMSSNIFSGHLSLSFFWDFYNVNVGMLYVVPDVS